MDTAKMCPSIRRTTFSLVLAFLLISALVDADHASSHGHHDHGHSTTQSSITVIEEETTKISHETNHEKHILSVSNGSVDSSSTVVSDDAHHKHQSHDHKLMNHDNHHQLHDTLKISPDHEMVLDQAPSDVVKLPIESANEHEEHGSSFMKHHSHSMDDMGHNHDMDGMDMDSNSSSPGMMMVFHTRIKEFVLFKEWKITTLGEMIASAIGIVLLGFLYEGLKYFREHLFKQYISSMQFSTVAVTGESGHATQIHKIERHRMMSLAHILQTGLHVVQIVISYFLMLIFMTYNVWLCLAVVVGSAIGFFIFGWKKATVVDITEHCH